MKNKKRCGIKRSNALLRGLLSKFLCLVLSSSALLSQNQIPQEIFKTQGGIEIEISDMNLVQELDKHAGITIDHGCNHQKAKLYVTQDGYDYLIANDISFNYLKRPEPIIRMKGPEELPVYRSVCMPAMDFYPTYEGYIELMTAFAEQYPDLCKLISIGTLDSGRELLVAQLGDDLEQDDDEPNFFYTSTMHGDETGGFPLMLQLIDHLLCNYSEDNQIRNLLDNVNIYINPLANPDGTYTNDNSTIDGATRRNANFIDLNRNYPDPEDGPNPDNRPTQDETQFFMDFAEEYNIQLSCNIHGGDEVVNYPWDTWEQLHADDSWWLETSRAYADTCHIYSDSSYLRAYENGVTNGYAWYEVNGGRQDFMNYFKRAREFTLEISNQKTYDATRLPELWEANRRSLLNYIEEALYGLRGTVVDCETGVPLEAEIVMENHDLDNSSVFTDSIAGNYFRYLDDGNYTAMIVAEGYDTIYSEITILDNEVLVLDVELCQTLSATEELSASKLVFRATQDYLYIDGLVNETIGRIQLFSTDGRLLVQEQDGDHQLDLSKVDNGAYIVRLQTAAREISKTLYLP